MDNNTTNVAEKIFKVVKNNLSSAKKYNKEKGLINATLCFGRHSQMVDISVWDNTIWKDGHKLVRSYKIKVNQNEVAELPNHYYVADVFSKLRTLFNEQKKCKGWGGLNFNSENIELESGTWNGYRVSVIPKVCLADAPCKEYKSLMNYINKYGVCLGWGNKPNYGNYEFFSSAMGGKRGRLWDEYGERIFLDNKPKKCERILEELRKYRGTNDKMICERGEEDYIDPIDRRFSEYHEVECEGEKRRYLKITIKTPNGKVKYESMLY